MTLETPKRRNRIAAGWAGFTLLITGLLTGCQSIPHRTEAEQDLSPPDWDIEIAAPERLQAEALALFIRGQLHDADGAYEEALASYQRVIERDPGADQAYFRAALNLFRLNRDDEALALLKSLVEQRPGEAQPLLWLSAGYRQNAQLKEATEVLAEALSVAPRNEAIYLQKVEALFQLDQSDRAVALLRQGIERSTAPLRLQRVLGELLMRTALLSEDREVRAQATTEAIELLEQVLEKQPNDRVLVLGLADLYLRTGQIQSALAHYESAAQLDPTDANVRERLAYLYERLERPEDAIRTLNELARLQPNNARVFYALAALHEEQDNRAQAIEQYRRAAQTGRPDPAPYLKLGVLQMEDAPEQAVADLQEGLELIPNHPRLLEMLGYVQFNREAYREAADAFDQAQQAWLELEPSRDAMTPNFHLYFALSHYFADEPEKAIPIMEDALLQNPQAIEAFAHFVFQDEREDRSHSAIEILETLLVDHADSIELWSTLGYLHSFHEDYEAALDAFDQAYTLIEAAGDDASDHASSRFYFWYAAAHERTEKYDRAEELFYRSLEMDPDNAEAYNYLAYMWAELGINLERAESYVQIALEARPESGAFIDTLGWIYYQQGRYDEAYTEIRRALDIIPDDPVILDHLGDIYYALDQLDQALVKWTRAYEQDPDIKDLATKLREHQPQPDPDPAVDTTASDETDAVDEDED